MKLIRCFAYVSILLVILTLQSGCEEAQRVQDADQIITITPETLQSAKPQEPAKKEAPTPETAKKAAPLLIVENPVHNFGIIEPSGKHTCEYRFKNAGTATLVISQIKSTCGCAVPQLKKKTYEPGESGVVKATYTASTRPANIEKHLYIVSNNPGKPQFELTIKAKIEVNFTISPTVMNLSLREDNAGAVAITVKSKDGKPFSIRSFNSTGSIVTADFDSTLKSSEFVLTPKIDLKKLAGTLNGTIVVNIAGAGNAQLTARFASKSLYEVSNPRIIIQDAKPGESIVREVLVKGNYEDAIEIESISSENKYMKVIDREDLGNRIKLTIEVTPPPQTATTRRYLTDKLNIRLKTGEVLTISCTGWYAR
ncbi:MAG: DUF1573 domain-containing protein [Planctomycetes bacterium]|nr:DUF1573 domain-containing protein [Planctomycetota bacterium]